MKKKLKNEIKSIKRNKINKIKINYSKKVKLNNSQKYYSYHSSSPDSPSPH